jgi:hypothetical protein
LPHIEAVIIEKGNGAQLWINNFSFKKAKFKRSYLYKKFRSEKTLRNPEDHKRHFICDTSTPRNKEKEIIQYLQSKYGVDIMKFPMKSIAGILPINSQK